MGMYKYGVYGCMFLHDPDKLPASWATKLTDSYVPPSSPWNKLSFSFLVCHKEPIQTNAHSMASSGYLIEPFSRDLISNDIPK